MAGKGVKLYLDEDVRPLLAEILRSRGYDAVSSVEKGHGGSTDKEQMINAIEGERAFLTHNVRDFVKLHSRFKEEHFGIIVSDQVPFKAFLRRILKFLSYSNPENVNGTLVWLSDFD